MDKPVRNAVRTYLIRNNKVLVIKNKEHDVDYYDIPGGKIEDGETSEIASIREFQEETGITITKQHFIGHNRVEYPNRIFEFDIYIVDDYTGEPHDFEENDSMWINLDELEKEPKIFPSIKAIYYLKDNMNLKMISDENHNVLDLKKDN